MGTYYINEQVFTGRSNIISSVIEAYCPHRPSEIRMRKSVIPEDAKLSQKPQSKNSTMVIVG